MSNRIADLRSTITTLEEARTAFAVYAVTAKEVAVYDARFDRDLAKRRATHESVTAIPRGEMAAIRERLVAFVSANRQLFEKPRTDKSPLGEFGLRTATELVIQDEEALVQSILERGYDDCMEVVRRPVKSALRKRIEAGETFPGAQVNTGDTVVCKVASDVIARAVEDDAKEG
jgi:hypothetical protein